MTEKVSFKRVVSSFEQVENISLPPQSFLQDAWRRLKKNKGAVVSLGIVVLFIILALLAPFISPHDPLEQNVQLANLPAKIPGVFKGMRAGVDAYAQAGVPEGIYYYLGTDGLGRDLLSRILYGTRLSLLIAFAAAMFDLTVGVLYGLISGWFGGRVDTVMQRVLEIMTAIPNLVILVLMLLFLQPGVGTIILAIGVTSWLTMARVVRAQTLKLKNLEYVLASKSLGQSFWKIALKHLLPNIAGIIIIQTMFSIPSAIFFEAFLSFLGIGVPVPNASLGSLINDGYKTFRFLPHLMWFPATVLCILMISFNLLADGLRDAFDPKMKE
ncbi:ABC transporter permease [uncultured Granulicatella sp.]|uniref:ABC transporter permease n=1 Tax=uncultured Granulicatella sp. TaxID=316089 RepID=UPI0028DBA7AB|nr:ABC transporter permease [uncultured Granulicatella sp.]